MNRSSKASNGGAAARRTWLRRVHRWFGLAALLFVLFLSATGIALNHTSTWQLDERYVGWPWLLDAYGIEAPEPSASYADGNHRATLLGRRLYVDGRELAREVGDLKGTVATGEFIVVATTEDIFVLTPSGELVERMSLVEKLPASINAIGLAENRLAVRSGDTLWRLDEALLNIEPWTMDAAAGVRWSTATPLTPGTLATLENLYRGRGVTVERLLTDVHSGRMFSRFGPLLMDAVAVLLILLSLTGLLMWMRRGGYDNANRKGRTGRPVDD